MNDRHTHNAYLNFLRVEFSRFIEDPRKQRKFYSILEISSYTYGIHGCTFDSQYARLSRRWWVLAYCLDQVQPVHSSSYNLHKIMYSRVNLCL